MINLFPLAPFKALTEPGFFGFRLPFVVVQRLSSLSRQEERSMERLRTYQRLVRAKVAEKIKFTVSLLSASFRFRFFPLALKLPFVSLPTPHRLGDYSYPVRG